MTGLAKCGTINSPHRIQVINGVGVCTECKAKFLDGVRQ